MAKTTTTIVRQPKPDWGRRGTQPKGKAGPKPPPNNQVVATQPKTVSASSSTDKP